MNIEDLRAEWSRMDGSQDALPDAALLARVQSRAREMEETIRRRDRRESIAAGVVFLFFLLPLITGPWLSRIGAGIALAACIVIVLQMRRARRAQPTSSHDRSLAEALAMERTHMLAQIRLLRTVPWWYAGPLAVGVVLVYAGASGATWSTLLYAVAVAVLSAVIIALNRRAVRTELLPALRALDQLRAPLQD